MKHFVTFLCLSLISCTPNTKLPEISPEITKQPKLLSEAGDVKTLNEIINDWALAQTEGRFSDYASFYNEGFFGIKRVGSIKSEFDLNSWLADRKRMFTAPMKVVVSQLYFYVQNGEVEVKFIQDWSSGDFRDRGNKVMQFKKVNSVWKISREEMLDSEIIPQIDNYGLLDPERAFLIIDDLYIVLGESTISSPSAPPPSFTSPTQRFTYEVDSESVPENYKTLMDSNFRIYNRNGEAVELKIDKILIMGTQVPHFGTIQRWDLRLESNPKELNTIFAEYAEGMRTYWVAELSNSVPDSYLALPAQTKEPSEFIIDKASDEDAMAVMTSFRASSLYESLESEIDEGLEVKIDYVKSIRSENAEYFWVHYEFFEHLPVSGNFIFKKSSSRYDLMGDFPDFEIFKSNILYDLNGNGMPDLITRESYASKSILIDGIKYSEFYTPFYDCPF